MLSLSSYEVQAENFVTTCKNLTNSLAEIQKIVVSEDSQLADAISEYVNNYYALSKKALTKFYGLAEIMHRYGKATISNEGNTQSEVNKYNSEISSISQMLDSISD